MTMWCGDDMNDRVQLAPDCYEDAEVVADAELIHGPNQRPRNDQVNPTTMSNDPENLDRAQQSCKHDQDHEAEADDSANNLSDLERERMRER